MYPKIVILDSSVMIQKYRRQLRDVPYPEYILREMLKLIFEMLEDGSIPYVNLLKAMQEFKERYQEDLSPDALKQMTDALVRMGFTLIDEVKRMGMYDGREQLAYQFQGLWYDNIVLTRKFAHAF